MKHTIPTAKVTVTAFERLTPQFIDLGIVDQRGRRIGVVAETVKYTAEPLAPDARGWHTAPVGVSLLVSVSATRNGAPFGPGQPGTFFAFGDAAGIAKYVAARAEATRKRYLKKFPQD